MYRMLVVDDEQVVLDSMRFIIENNFRDRIELHTAKSGRDAIGEADETKFDIIFIDLKMPGINGIDASKEIRERHKEVNIVFVTAYEAFDFAKEAIQLGVKEYLLKPVNKDDVIGLINRLLLAIETSRGRRKDQLLLREKFHAVLPVLEGSFINALLLSDAGADDLAKYREILDINENGGYIITVELRETERSETELSPRGFSLGFKNSPVFDPVFEAVRIRYRCIITALTVNRIVVFVPCANTENEYNQRITAIELGKYIKRKISEQVGVPPVLIGIGRCFNGIENVVLSYEESLKAIHYNDGSDLQHIMDLEQKALSKRSYPVVREKQMLRNIALAREDEALQDFDYVFSWLLEEYGKNIETFRAKITELDVLLNRLLREYGDSADDSLVSHDDSAITIGVSLVPEIRGWFCRRIRTAVGFIRNKKSSHESALIKKIKAFVQEKYAEEINLSLVARNVNISPHYLSKIFKDETETSFIQFLTSVRLEKAKELLKCGCFTMKEVCFRIGYTDPNYFSRLFKKVVGVSPTQFRDEEVGWEPGSGVYTVPGLEEDETEMPHSVRIGLSLASVYEDRWKKDKEAFVGRASELNAEVFIRVADNNCEKQIQQVYALLEKGIDVLVIITQNSERMARVIEDAKSRKVRVISYCRLIMNADIDMYIAFDGIRIGELMAETIIDEVPTGNYVIVNGSAGDYNSQMYNQGIKNILQESIQNERIRIIDEIWAHDWQPSDAVEGLERIITQGNNIDAVICGNDTLAEAVIQVLGRYNLAGTTKVTGHDADFSGIKRTMDGTQLMTVYTSFESLASQAADYAIRLAKGKEIVTHWSIFNGLKNIPYHKKQPIAVTRDNVKEIMKVSGYPDRS